MRWIHRRSHREIMNPRHPKMPGIIHSDNWPRPPISDRGPWCARPFCRARRPVLHPPSWSFQSDAFGQAKCLRWFSPAFAESLSRAHSIRSFDAIILLQGYAILANLSLKQSLCYFVDFSPGAITFISPFKTSFRIAFMKYRASISNTFFSRSCIKTYFTFLILTRPIFRVST